MAPRTTPQDRKPKTLKAAVTPPAGLVEIVTADAPEVEMVPLFSIDGQVFSVPSKVSASMALRVMDTARRSSMEAAMSGALEELLGPESYQALLQCQALTLDQLETIMSVVQEMVLGDLEASSGK